MVFVPFLRRILGVERSVDFAPDLEFDLQRQDSVPGVLI